MSLIKKLAGGLVISWLSIVAIAGISYGINKIGDYQRTNETDTTTGKTVRKSDGIFGCTSYEEIMSKTRD
jgi:hypothetical protein